MQRDTVDYKKDQLFLEKSQNKIWRLLDIYEVQSLLHKSTSNQVVVHLFDIKSKKIRRLNFANFESNYFALESNLAEQVLILNKLFKIDLIPNKESHQD